MYAIFAFLSSHKCDEKSEAMSHQAEATNTNTDGLKQIPQWSADSPAKL